MNTLHASELLSRYILFATMSLIKQKKEKVTDLIEFVYSTEN
jgi:hypothetical protein